MGRGGPEEEEQGSRGDREEKDHPGARHPPVLLLLFYITLKPRVE